jgi:hypothetical protein
MMHFLAHLPAVLKGTLYKYYTKVFISHGTTPSAMDNKLSTLYILYISALQNRQQETSEYCKKHGSTTELSSD